MTTEARSAWPRPVVAFEIRGTNSAQMQNFYRTMFEWNLDTTRIPGLAFVEPGIGGPEPGVGGTLTQNERPGTILYIQVADLKTSMNQAEELGGKQIVQPFDVPGGPTIAQIADPDGNVIGLVQL